MGLVFPVRSLLSFVILYENIYNLLLLSPLQFASAVSVNYNFVHKGQVNQLALCTCAKCGSTSLLTALCQSFRGSQNDSRCIGKSVYYTQLWGSNEQKNKFRRFFGIKPNSHAVYLWSYRDPVERYMSAYRSKVQCCNNISRVPCIPPQNYYFSQNLITMTRGYKIYALRPGTNASNLTCLFVEEFVSALEIHHFRKEQNKLEQHFSPQYLECRVPNITSNPNATIFLGNISEISDKLQKMDARNYGFTLNFTVPRITKRWSYTNIALDSNIMKRLCWISLEEYKRMIDIEIPSFCGFERKNIGSLQFNLTFEL